MAGEYPKSLADVNRAVRPFGVRFYRSPAGYYYPVALDGSWTGEGVYVYNAAQVNIDFWIKEAQGQKGKFSRQASRRANTLPSGMYHTIKMVQPWTDAYGTPAQDLVKDYTGADGKQMQPLRRRRDYGEREPEVKKRIEIGATMNTQGRVLASEILRMAKSLIAGDSFELSQEAESLRKQVEKLSQEADAAMERKDYEKVDRLRNQATSLYERYVKMQNQADTLWTQEWEDRVKK